MDLPDGRIFFDDGLQRYQRDVFTTPNHFEIFDPKTDSWSYPLERPVEAVTRPPLNSSLLGLRPNFWSSLIGETIGFSGYIPNGPQQFGNDAASVHMPIAFRDGSELNVYDDFELKTAKGSKLVSNPPIESNNARVYNLIDLPDERIFFGRQNFYGGAFESIYTAKTDTWQLLNDPLAATGQTATLLPDGKILVIGGALARVSLFQRVSDFYHYHFDPIIILAPPVPEYVITSACRLYDPVTDSWKITQHLNRARAFHTTNLLPDGRILVSGGFTTPTDDGMTNTCEIISLRDVEQ